MKTCPNCRCQTEDADVYCPVCGNALNVTPLPSSAYVEEPQYVPPVPEVSPFDHTENFSPEDIENHKLLCMLVYLLDFFGMIIALLAAKESEFTAFHMKQSMKFTVIEALIGIVTLLLAWTVIVPVVALVAIVIVLILKLISFCQVCKGQAKEPAIIRSIKFLK